MFVVRPWRRQATFALVLLCITATGEAVVTQVGPWVFQLITCVFRGPCHGVACRIPPLMSVHMTCCSQECPWKNVSLGKNCKMVLLFVWHSWGESSKKSARAVGRCTISSYLWYHTQITHYHYFCVPSRHTHAPRQHVTFVKHTVFQAPLTRAQNKLIITTQTTTSLTCEARRGQHHKSWPKLLYNTHTIGVGGQGRRR